MISFKSAHSGFYGGKRDEKVEISIVLQCEVIREQKVQRIRIDRAVAI